MLSSSWLLKFPMQWVWVGPKTSLYPRTVRVEKSQSFSTELNFSLKCDPNPALLTQKRLKALRITLSPVRWCGHKNTHVDNHITQQSGCVGQLLGPYINVDTWNPCIEYDPGSDLHYISCYRWGLKNSGLSERVIVSVDDKQHAVQTREVTSYLAIWNVGQRKGM